MLLRKYKMKKKNTKGGGEGPCLSFHLVLQMNLKRWSVCVCVCARAVQTYILSCSL